LFHDHEIQIAILNVLMKYYSTDEFRSYVNKDFVRKLTSIPKSLFEENLQYLLDKGYVIYHPEPAFTTPSRIRITAEGVDFKRANESMQQRVEHLSELKEHVIQPLMRNIAELVIEPRDPFYGSWEKGIVYHGQEPLKRILADVDPLLYQDAPNHFPPLREDWSIVQDALGEFSTKRNDFIKSLKSDFSLLSNVEDAIPVAIAGLFTPQRLSEKLREEYEALDSRISQYSRDKFHLVKTTSEMCETKLKEFRTLLDSFSFSYKLVGKCSYVRDITVHPERISESDLHAILESISLDVGSIKAIVTQMSLDYPKLFEEIIGNQNRLLQFKADLEAIRKLLPKEEHIDVVRQIEEQVDRFNRWKEFSAAVINLINIANQYVQSHPEILHKVLTAFTRFVFGQ